jgi:diguanylate cyclase (GGDEF)-like protein
VTGRPPRSEERSAVLEAALDATRCLDVGSCLESVARGAVELTTAEFASAYRVQPSGARQLERVAVAPRGDAEPAPDHAPLSIDVELAEHLAPSGTVVLEDATLLGRSVVVDGEVEPKGESASPRSEAPREALLALVEGAAGSIGAILAVSASGQHLAPEGAVRLDAFRRELAPALENLRTIEALRSLVVLDDTADCFNRRHLDACLEDERARVRRFGGRFAIVFVDMDDLKSVNTRYGHARGSRAVYQVSTRLQRNLRSIDRVFRYGGDEFLVLLPGATLEGAREVAERMRLEVHREPFRLDRGVVVGLSVSAGVAAWPEHGPASSDLISAADRAMRRVKASGRNAVLVASSDDVRTDDEGSESGAS